MCLKTGSGHHQTFSFNTDPGLVHPGIAGALLQELFLTSMTIRMAARMIGAEQKGRGPVTATAAAIAAAALGGGAAPGTGVHSDTLIKMPSAIRESGICISENCTHAQLPMLRHVPNWNQQHVRLP